MLMPISCVLLDVGGTLWASGWTDTAAITETRIAQLRELLPELTDTRARQLERRLNACYAEHRQAMRAAGLQVQNTDAVIRTVAEEFGLPSNNCAVQAIRRAMCVTPIGRVTLFDGAEKLLQQIKAWGLVCVAVSNTTWRGSDAIRRDFEDLDIRNYVDAVISSVDVGFHKPHPAMFEAALAAAGCAAPACVMIGNSELKDIAPALVLGMRTIRVAIEQPLPVDSAAHAIVDSLGGVGAVLRAWIDPRMHTNARE